MQVPEGARRGHCIHHEEIRKHNQLPRLKAVTGNPCRITQMLELPGARVTGNCKKPGVSARFKRGSSPRAVYANNH